MLRKPLVSIVIPCYNAESWVVETLESALSQTWPDKEIIVVDDGSSDNSLSVVKSFESLGVKVIAQENRGGCAARNRCLEEAKGDFIQYLDADDLLAPDKIERQIETLDGRDDCVVTAKWGRFYESPDDIMISPEPIYTDFTPLDWAASVLSGKGSMVLHCWLIPRRIIEQAGPWNEEILINQDGEYFFRVVLASQRVLFCPDALCYYRSGLPGSVSRNKSEKSWASAFRVCELCAEELLKTEDSLHTRRACANAFQRFAYNAYPHVPSLVAQAEERAEKLGGADITSKGTPLYLMLARVLPWKMAKKAHRLLRPPSP